MLSGLLALFVAAFGAATLLPLSSELVLYALLRQGGDPVLLVAVASVGNTLGSCVNWALGRFLLRFRDRSWFYFSPAQIERAQRWFRRQGVWSLLLAWVPVAGDALTLVAGVLRVRLPLFLLLVATGKTLRYASLVLLVQ